VAKPRPKAPPASSEPVNQRWNCGECGDPVTLHQGTKKGSIYYNCQCGAHVRVEPKSKSHSGLLAALLEQLSGP
jgi:hypothetical protein